VQGSVGSVGSVFPPGRRNPRRAGAVADLPLTYPNSCRGWLTRRVTAIVVSGATLPILFASHRAGSLVKNEGVSFSDLAGLLHPR
jgi:hypothetical protein